uniref:Phosphoprotein n=1 Tax=Measles virus genotype D8 TaxID=170528 RepID=A0A7G4WHR8_9MONO|nr:phosphoprotein [Measles virus genotype D8]
MAEEQARHVKNGLECIRALKAEPIGSLAVEEAMAAWSEISDNPGQDRATCKEEKAGSSGLSKPCLSAIGSTEGGAPRIRGQGSGESDDDAEALGIPSRNLQASSTGLQCYHVYDHSGEAVKGIQDADSIMVQSGLDGDSTLSGGDDESENSDVDIGEPDTEGYAITDRGSAPISVGFRASDVETAEGGEIHELLRLQSRGNNFPKLGKTLNVPPPPNPGRASASETPIKKGTDARLASFGTEIASLLTGGATQCARKSPSEPSGPGAPVENVPECVSNAALTQEWTPESGTTISPRSQNNEEGGDYYDDELFSDVQDIKTALAKIHEDNQKIISKLESLLLLKGEVESIKKQINKQNISISTLEGHLSSIMIAIPGLGKDPNDPTADVELNPDLKPIIGRDSGRALAEVLKKPAASRQLQGMTNGRTSSRGQLLKEFQLKPIGKKMSSAVGFVPDTGPVSRSVIRSIIKSSRLEEDRKRYLMTLLDDIKGANDLAKFHQMLMKIIMK